MHVDPLLELNGLLGARLRGALIGDHDLSATAARVVMELSRAKSLTNAKIARLIASDTAHVSRTVAELLKLGLVVRSTVATSGRERPIGLSATGHEAASGIAAQQLALLAPLRSVLNTNDDILLRKLNAALRDLLATPQGGANIEVRPAGGLDLFRLVGQIPDDLGPDEGERRALLRHRCQEALHNLDQPHGTGWIVRNWGEPVGGCVLSPADDHEHGRIDLLQIKRGMEREAGKPLLAACLEAAKVPAFTSLSTTPRPCPDELATLLSELGFHPSSYERDCYFGHNNRLMVWTRTMLPPIQRP